MLYYTFFRGFCQYFFVRCGGRKKSGKGLRRKNFFISYEGQERAVGEEDRQKGKGVQKKNDVKFRRPRNKKECVEKCVGCRHGGRKDTAAEFQKLRRRPFDGCRTIITIIFSPFDRGGGFLFFVQPIGANPLFSTSDCPSSESIQWMSRSVSAEGSVRVTARMSSVTG